MQNILNLISIRENVHPSFLGFCGIQDETETIGKKLFLYNIEDPDHPKYKSTVAFVVASPGQA